MLTGKYLELHHRLSEKIDTSRMFHDPLRTLAYGTDAGFYRLIPKLVIRANNEDEILHILKHCHNLTIAVTFRAAGTSLSGQAITDSVLVIAGHNWKKYRIDDNGLRISLQPGIVGAKANVLLAPYGRKIGPDPASINAAMIGGIAANNASGMCCGTAENSYNTLHSMRIIFADGTLLDTANAASREQFSMWHPEIIEGIEQLVVDVRNNKQLAARIARKYKMKNTTGYSLNALIDYTDPFEVIQHLLIGSEGTLGFISEITFHTVIEHPCKASALMVFEHTEDACKAVINLKSQPVSAVELIDRAGMRSVENEKDVPAYLKTVSPTACAILVETRAADKLTLWQQIDRILKTVENFRMEVPNTFTDVPHEYALLWKIRKGLFPTVGAMRASGTTVIIEDVAFPVERLAEATLELQGLFAKWDYNEAVLFGHALEGNLHFVFTQDFGTAAEVERYSSFMDELAHLVVDKYDGSLKAEHGTGRNMAPYVELEWGSEAYAIMKRIKQIFDPLGLLNPGVILNNDQYIHLKNLKPLPIANAIIDKCIECGFCEPQCVSEGFTLSPRQRIVAYREMARLKATGTEPHMAAAMAKDFQYVGNDTCATDGLCALSCPVKIDTGKLVKELRAEQSTIKQKFALFLADNMTQLTAIMRVGLSFVGFAHKIFGTRVMLFFSKIIHAISFEKVPMWNAAMPHGVRKINTANSQVLDKKVVYFPSCVNRTMGNSATNKSEKQVSEAMLEVLQKAGYSVIFPDNMNNLCCGMPFLSKGFVQAGQKKSIELENQIWEASDHGKLPVLCDMSPCLFTMKEHFSKPIQLFEPVEFILEKVIPLVDIKPVDEKISVFTVCSMKKMGLEDKLIALAKLCATEVVVAESNCCGFAGDRGFLVPELNAHGLRDLKEQLKGVSEGFSTSRTCEIGLSQYSGITHKSIVNLVNRVSERRK